MQLLFALHSNLYRDAKLGLPACMQVGNHLFAQAERKDLHKYDIAADKDDSVPTPEPPEGQTVAGKPREFLKYAPMWAAHPDHDRVRPLDRLSLVCCKHAAPV